MTIKNILVPLDGSKNSFRALAESIKLAKLTGASITGIFVIQAFPTEMGIVRTVIGNALSKKSKDFLKKAKSRCKKNNVEFFDVTEFGHEGQTIVSFAEKNKYDIIVIGSRGMGIIKETFLGSTSHYVVHTTKLPVLIVK
ncbi:MAG: universal stress protein [Nitrosopumilaceae archaeon]|jgi:nucleotide-binding universal stress UspA family protein